jgi:hypothetical protein
LAADFVNLYLIFLRRQRETNQSSDRRQSICAQKMLSIAITALASSSKLSSSRVGPALKLRGGGVSPDDAIKVVSTLTALSSGVGYVYTKEMMDQYELTDPLSPQTKMFTKMNFGVQGAAAVLLMKPELFLVALAGTFYSLADQMGEVFDMPRYPLFAWAILPFVFEWAMEAGHLPAWAFGAFLIANGVAGIAAWDTIYELYQAKAKLDKTGEAMGKFAQGAFVAIGAYLVSQAQGNTAVQSFGYLAAIFTAAILKMALVDGKGCFNPVGAYVWAAIYAAASGIALTA